MSGLAASGGYYIAMDADRIIANPATLTFAPMKPRNGAQFTSVPAS